jgi:hypothetical protein
MSNNEPSQSGGPELRLLADLRRQHAEPDAPTVDRLRHVVLNATRPDATRPGPASAHRNRRPWRIAIPVASTAFAAAAVLGAGAILTDHPGDRPAPRAGTGTTGTGSPLVGDAADAKLVMTLAARTTQSTPRLTAGPGQYVYRQTTSTDLSSYSYPVGDVNVFASQQRQDWLDPRRGLADVRYISTDAIVGPVTARDADLAATVGLDLHAAPKTTDSDHQDQSGKPGNGTAAPQPPSLRNPTQQYLDGLPTDPAKLLATIRREAKAEDNSKWSTGKTAFGMVSDLIAWGDPMLSPELRAGLYRALAMMPGVTRVPGTSELRNGAKGVAVGFAEGGTREEIIFDPTTLRPLGTRDVALRATGGVPAGTVVSVTYFDFRIVDGVGRTD